MSVAVHQLRGDMDPSVSQAANPLPGFELRSKWAAKLGKCDRTAKRWLDAGHIVVRYIGKEPYVDLEATAARMRGEDGRRRRKP
jgi:hypothetical protein